MFCGLVVSTVSRPMTTSAGNGHNITRTECHPDILSAGSYYLGILSGALGPVALCPGSAGLSSLLHNVCNFGNRKKVHATVSQHIVRLFVFRIRKKVTDGSWPNFQSRSILGLFEHDYILAVPPGGRSAITRGFFDQKVA